MTKDAWLPILVRYMRTGLSFDEYIDTMGSTLRADLSRARILERLAIAGDKRSDLTLGQLVTRAVLTRDPEAMALRALDEVSDVDLIEAVERYVLLAEVPTKPGVRQT